MVEVSLAAILVLLILLWLGQGIIVNLLLPGSKQGYECDPFDFTPCIQYSGLGPEPEAGPGTVVMPVCPVCQTVNRVALGLVALDLILLAFILISSISRKKG